jgi:hypothetical protein
LQENQRIVIDIVKKKELCTRRLLSLSESPIEEIFMSHLLLYIENSTINDAYNNQAARITGFKYLQKFERISLNPIENVIGVELIFSSTIGLTFDESEIVNSTIEDDYNKIQKGNRFLVLRIMGFGLDALSSI